MSWLQWQRRHLYSLDREDQEPLCEPSFVPMFCHQPDHSVHCCVARSSPWSLIDLQFGWNGFLKQHPYLSTTDTAGVSLKGVVMCVWESGEWLHTSVDGFVRTFIPQWTCFRFHSYITFYFDIIVTYDAAQILFDAWKYTTLYWTPTMKLTFYRMATTELQSTCYDILTKLYHYYLFRIYCFEFNTSDTIPEESSFHYTF